MTSGRLMKAKATDLDVRNSVSQLRQLIRQSPDSASSHSVGGVLSGGGSLYSLVSDGYSLPAMADDLGALISLSVLMEMEAEETLGRTLHFEEVDELKESILKQLRLRKASGVVPEWIQNQRSLDAQKQLSRREPQYGLSNLDHTMSNRAGIRSRKLLGTPLLTGAMVKKWQNAYLKLAGDPGLRVLHKLCDGNLDNAVAGLMMAISTLQVKFGSAGIRADWALEYILKMLHIIGKGGDEDPGWLDSGDGSPQWLSVALQLGPLIELLKLEYEPYTDSLTYTPVPAWTEADEIDVSALRSFTTFDVSRLMTSEYAYPDEVGMMRLGTRSAMQRIPLATELVTKPNCNIKMLVDCSGSMMETYECKALGETFTLWQYAIASAVALLDRAMLHGSHKVRLWLFDSMARLVPESDPKKLIKLLLGGGANFSGGGTSFSNALYEALKYTGDPEMQDEIIMVTDGEDSIGEAFDLAGHRLTTYYCGPRENHGLTKLSDRYYRVT